MSSDRPPRGSFRMAISNLGHAVTGHRWSRRRYPLSAGSHHTALPPQRRVSTVSPAQLRATQPGNQPGNQPTIRSAIQSALTSRSAFETAFQSVTNEVLSGDSEMATVAVDEIFQELRDVTVPFSSKSLGLEVSDRSH